MILADNPLLTIPQAMARLGVSRAWIYKMRKAGNLTIVKLGGMARMRSSEVARLLEHGTEGHHAAQLPTNCLPGVTAP